MPGIEPGLPECSEEIRIRSDNRYTTQPLFEQQLILLSIGDTTCLYKVATTRPHLNEIETDDCSYAGRRGSGFCKIDLATVVVVAVAMQSLRCAASVLPLDSLVWTREKECELLHGEGVLNWR